METGRADGVEGGIECETEKAALVVAGLKWHEAAGDVDESALQGLVQEDLDFAGLIGDEEAVVVVGAGAGVKRSGQVGGDRD